MIVKYMTVYAHQLKDPSKSFNNELKLKDFVGHLQWDMTKAERVMYVNPRGEYVVIKHRVKV